MVDMTLVMLTHMLTMLLLKDKDAGRGHGMGMNV